MSMEYDQLNEYFDYKGAEVFIVPQFDQLPSELQTSLGAQLIKVGQSGFNRPNDPAFGEDIIHHLKGGELMITMVNGAAEAFAVRKHYPELNAVYMAGSVKTTAAPSGVIEEITRRYVHDREATAVVTRTQNDRVIEMVARICPQVVPLDGLATDKELSLLYKMGLLQSGMNLDPRGLILKGFYGAPMISSLDRRRCQFDRITKVTNQLDYQAGDAMLVVGYR